MASTDITPEGSASPVRRSTNAPKVTGDMPLIGAPDPVREALRESAMEKLVNGQPLTPEEAALVIGASATPL